MKSCLKLFRRSYYDTNAVWDFAELITDMWTLFCRFRPQLLWPQENLMWTTRIRFHKKVLVGIKTQNGCFEAERSESFESNDFWLENVSSS